MSISGRRVRAIYQKELRKYRRHRPVMVAMAIFPVLFLVQPVITVFALPASSAGQIAHHHEPLYLLAIPALVDAILAAYAAVGNRQQRTLGPVLSPPARRVEFLLGKAIAVLVPAMAIFYAVFALSASCIELFAQSGVSPALLAGPDVLAQLIFTPLLAGSSI